MFFIGDEDSPFKCFHCIPTIGIGIGIFEGIADSSDVFGDGGGGSVLGLSQYRKNILIALSPTTSTPMAVDCTDQPMDSDVSPSASLFFSASRFLSLSRATLASLFYSGSFLPAAIFFGSFSFLGVWDSVTGVLVICSTASSDMF